MHAQTVARFAHSHETSDINAGNERRTLLRRPAHRHHHGCGDRCWHLTGSMPCCRWLAHGNPRLRLGISYAAYLLARKHDASDYFSFGTGSSASLPATPVPCFSLGRDLDDVRVGCPNSEPGKDRFCGSNLGDPARTHRQSRQRVDSPPVGFRSLQNHDHDHDHDNDHSHHDHNYRGLPTCT